MEQGSCNGHTMGHRTWWTTNRRRRIRQSYQQSAPQQHRQQHHRLRPSFLLLLVLKHVIKIGKKMMFWWVFDYFQHKSPILETLLTFKKIWTTLMHYWTYLIKTLHLSIHMTIFGVINFLIEKVAKLVETQKFCQNRSNHLILH